MDQNWSLKKLNKSERRSDCDHAVAQRASSFDFDFVSFSPTPISYFSRFLFAFNRTEHRVSSMC